MSFIFLVFAAAFSIEIIGSYLSVMGLAAIFNSNWVIMTMALVLDFAKIMTVSFLYNKWTSMNKIMRIYMFAASAVLMLITSAGTFGYLSAEFQNAVIPSKESSIKLQTLSDEQQRLQTRKIEIDKQIAQIPPGAVRSRIKLMDSFKEETQKINSRLIEIDTELPKIKIDNVNVSAHIGPIAYVATAFGVSMEAAIKYVILLIDGVFDPLAIALILAGNFLVAERKRLPLKLDDPVIVTDVTEDQEYLNVAPVEEPPIEETQADVNDSLESEPQNNPWELVPIQHEIAPSEAEEPVSKVRTEKQLDKLCTKFIHSDKNDLSALDDALINDGILCTTMQKDDTIIHTPLKGIMEAATNHSGAEIFFDDTSSTSTSHYI